MMDLTEDEVESVEEAHAVVEDLIEVAGDSAALDEDNLRLLEVQLDSLHQALAMAVAQKQGLAAGDE